MGKTIGIDFQSEFSSNEEDIIREEVHNRIADMVKEGYKSGELVGQDPYYRGWWNISIEDDENDEDIRNEEVAKAIRNGNTSGYYPTFSFSANVWNTAAKGKAWFKEAVEAKAPYNLAGWSKSLPAAKRRGLALKSRNKKLSKHKQYVSAGRALQALANVTKDATTKKVAKEDAEYFFNEAKKFEFGGMVISRKEAIDTIKDKLGKEKVELSKWSDLDLELEYKRLFNTEVAIYADGGGVDDDYPEFIESDAAKNGSKVPTANSKMTGDEFFEMKSIVVMDNQLKREVRYDFSIAYNKDYNSVVIKETDYRNPKDPYTRSLWMPFEGVSALYSLLDKLMSFHVYGKAANGTVIESVWNASFFDKDNKFIYQTQLDEKDEGIAWEMFEESHIKEPGMYIRWEEETDPEEIIQARKFNKGGKAADGTEIDAMVKDWKAVKKALGADGGGMPHDMKVLDIESNSVHKPVLIDYEEDFVIMESEEYGRTRNSLERVKFIFEAVAPVEPTTKKVIPTMVSPAEAMKQKQKTTTTPTTTTVTTTPTTTVTKQPAFQKAEKKEPSKYAEMLKKVWQEAKGQGLVIISESYMEKIEEAILNDLSDLVYEEMLREAFQYLLDKEIVLKSKIFMKGIKTTLE